MPTAGSRLPASGSRINEVLLIDLPVWCACGKPVTYPGEHRCEDCYANDQQRYDGKPTRVDVPHLSMKQEAEIERRSAHIKQVFKSGSNG